MPVFVHLSLCVGMFECMYVYVDTCLHVFFVVFMCLVFVCVWCLCASMCLYVYTGIYVFMCVK